jgi:WD40 repeat protein
MQHIAYIGDVTALHATHIPLHPPQHHIQLVFTGIGSQLHIYSLPDGRRLACRTVLPHGVRIHGITSTHTLTNNNTLVIAIHGDCYVTFYSLSYLTDKEWHLSLLCDLPPLPYWTMALHLAPIATINTDKTAFIAAVGMCDNSVQLHLLHTSSTTSTISCTFLAHYECTEHSLLYSMSIHSSNGYLDATTGKERIPMNFQVASGTILLDVITWSFKYSLVLDNNETSPSSSLIAVPLQYRLQGHEGSIHRVRWSHTGTTLASASDDRTLRIWHLDDNNEERTSSAEGRSNVKTIEASLVLWGHTGRLWDCAYLGPDCNYIMSVSEDCSYRVWNIEDGGGRCVTHVGIGHRGRGIWQCAVLIPSSSSSSSSSSPLVLNGEGSSKDVVLVTGGADGSVKCWLHTVSEEKSERVEVIEWCLKGILTGMNANKDWVRELVLLPDMTTLYMATHYGLVLQAHLNRRECEVVYCSPSNEGLKEVAVTRRGEEDVLALGDKSGAVAIVCIPCCSSSSVKSSPSTASLMVRWMPHPKSRTILSLFWYSNKDDNGNTLILFSTDLRGELAAWKVAPFLSSSLEPEMIGRGQSPYTSKIRITALAATNGFVVTGDTGGNLVVWKWTYHHQQQQHQQQSPVLEAVASLKGALPMAVIRTITLKSLDTAVAENKELMLEIRIGGSEGLLATVGFRYNNNKDYYENKIGELTGRLVVLQRERITAPSIIDCEVICREDEEGGGCQRLIAGYAESSFVVYDADAEAEVARVQAGGWRRANTSLVSINNNNNNNGKDMLVLCHCKGDQLVVHKQILRDRKSDPPRSLHTGHHGREMHAVLFLPTITTSSSVNKQHMLLTGGEDGSIRQLMWSSSPSVECYFHRSVLLGEHPAMATVRALSAVCIPNDNRHHHYQQQQWVLFSAGTRQVLATWLLTSSTISSPPPPSPRQQQQQQLQCQPLGFPYNPAAGVANTKKFSKGLETDIELRWMSLSAFYHHNTPTASSSSSNSGGGIIFVVAGGSDGTLILLNQGLHTAIHVNDINDNGVKRGLSTQKAACWPVAAELHYHEAPILSTAYVCVQGRHLLLSGATDGCIVLWDLTPATIVKEKETEVGNSNSPPPLQLSPTQVLHSTHQSGVNALDVAAVVGTGNPTPNTLFVVSGGDDQAIAVNIITLSSRNNDNNNNQATVNHVTQSKVECAHSSAVKGIWTDGCHIVSVGLDQRVRRWNIIIHNNNTSDNGNNHKGHDDVHIKEKGWYTSQCIEPAAVDVNGDYIAIAGRGCQLLLHK